MAGELVKFPSNGGQGQGYLAKPAGKGPGVVVIQEWWGLNDNIKDIADRLAAEGFVALAPDLYNGQVTKEPDEAMKLMMAMKVEQAAKDISGAVDYLIASDATSGSKVGSIGFCMGGGLSLYLATLKPQVGACVIYYGVVPGVQPDLSKIGGAVLGHYADHDDWASADTVNDLKKKLQSLGKDVEFHTYPDTQHGFFNDTRTEVHAPEASKLSWERTIAFYRKHLS
jgi:carboxymethylenebutenolidase